MGPRSDNRGYVGNAVYELDRRKDGSLQWVHGPITVVMRIGARDAASAVSSFNGSTVR